MQAKQYYHDQRREWAPKNLRLIVIAESPPADGHYLYDVEGNTRESLFMELLIQLFGVVPKSKKAGLRALQQWGVILLDATYTSLHGLKPAARNNAVKESIPTLIEELESIDDARDVPIVLIKKNVCDLLEAPLVAAGFKVANDGTMVAFPGSGQQANFRKTFSEILNEHVYAPEEKMISQALKDRLARK